MKSYYNLSLKTLNTFGIDHLADRLLVFQERDELMNYFDRHPLENSEYLILGQGSNLLFTKDFHGTIIKPEIKGITVLKENDQYVWIRGEAGESWSEFVNFSVTSGYQGLENLASIPGSLGAAPVQNIGAYGVELSDYFESLETLNISTNQINTLNKEQCMFGYRNSVFKRNPNSSEIILSVTVRLNKFPNYHLSYAGLDHWSRNIPFDLLSPGFISSKITEIRNKKLPDPRWIGNAGSFFKNPSFNKPEFEELRKTYPEIPGFETVENKIKIPAGWMIEKCGWKGYRRGDTGVFENQALVLVNYGKAAGSDILQLARDIQASVEDHFGVRLEPEVKII